MHQSKTAPYVFLLPAALLVIIIVVYPMIYGVMLAFTDSNLHSFETHFVGLQNFAQFFDDARFNLGAIYYFTGQPDSAREQIMICRESQKKTDFLEEMKE